MTSIEIRHNLFDNPEVSGTEYKTVELIIKKLQIYHPDILTSDIKDGHGVIAIFKGKKQGKNIAFRTDIDALPSGHRCGHDGHTAILLQFAEYIVSGNRPETGSIILIFQ
ncbi:MAG: hypothetical protein PHE45_03545, partial [Bacteroidales bacterium]|nr:hypothetical protein [Bacteroidales bacterium]